MIKKKINRLRKQFKDFGIDGYIIPKNDEFFSEYAKNDRLRYISNFSGSAGYAVILKSKNYLFVDGRYTIQAKIESGKHFKIVDYFKIINTNVFKNLNIGIDPKLFTSEQIKKFFLKNNKVTSINENLVDNILKAQNKKGSSFYSIGEKITGENHLKKISKVASLLKKNKSDYLFITAPENIAWLLNIRGHDNPTSPIPNCNLILSKEKKFYLIVEKSKSTKLISEKKLKKEQIVDPKNLNNFLNRLKNKNVIIDQKTCSLYLEKLFRKRYKLISMFGTLSLRRQKVHHF